MNEQVHFEHTLRAWFESEARRRLPDDRIEAVLQRTADMRPLPRWRALLTASVMRTQSTVTVGSPALRLAYLAALAALVALPLAIGTIVMSGALPRSPSVGPPAVSPSPTASVGCLPPPPVTTRITEIDMPYPPGTVVFADCSFWVEAAPGFSVVRIDPFTNRVAATITVTPPDGDIADLAAEGDSLWASTWSRGQLRLMRVDPATNSVARMIQLPSGFGDKMLIVDGQVWLSGFESTRQGVIDLETGDLVREIPGAAFVDFGFGAVWAHSEDPYGILRIEPTTFEVSRIAYPVADAYLTAVSDTGLWLSGGARGEMYKLSPTGELLLTVQPATDHGTGATAVTAALGRYVIARSHVYLDGEGEPARTEILVIDDVSGAIVEHLDYTVAGWTELMSGAGGSFWLGHHEAPTLVRYEMPAAPDQMRTHP